MLDPGRLMERCSDVLTAIEDHYASASVELPERRFVSAGNPAYDCELVAVWCERYEPHEGDVSFAVGVPTTARPGFGLLVGSFVATIVRKTCAVLQEGALPPTAEQEEAAAALLYGDALLMHGALATAIAMGMAGCNSLVFTAWSLNQAEVQAGWIGGELRFRMAMNN